MPSVPRGRGLLRRLHGRLGVVAWHRCGPADVSPTPSLRLAEVIDRLPRW